ncbi:C3H1-type domain-containing protein [Madurella fahalii]|uniref:C3H1-type domain-containing protein n=1 Tax=Madurella fahalii TaxID=1157608 RepID=A0ABQ0GGE2_9PEZI
MATSHPSEHRHLRSGSLNIQPQSGRAGAMMSPMPAPHRFDGPRSPPNTSHVPCKFFRQGACQAGNACPFSHDLSAASENVCKYFAKGNCKFGPKCANIHVLPDGRRVNYGKNGVTIGPPGVALGARVNPTTYHQPSNSALTNSFLRADAYTAVPPYPLQDERYVHQLGRQPSMENGLPTIDTTYSSNPASVYGSPRDEDANRLGLGLSPVNTKGLSVLDAPLPASFDSNGISHAARYGPWPSSVPTKFGLESPSPSLNAARDGRTSETLKLLHTSAFGSNEHLSPSAIGVSDANGFGSSPPVGVSGLGSGLGSDEYFGKRAMHSSSLRYTKPRLISSSVPKIDRDWEAEFLFEEDYVPGALANEVLTPAEKARRGSTTNTVRPVDSVELGVESVPISATKFGSPAMAGSPSRWGSLWQRQQKDEDGFLDAPGSGRPIKHSSAFGHVGSPLRNSSLATAIAAELNSDSSSDTAGRHGSGSESLSALTQQLRETRLGDGASGSSSPRLHPNVPRNGNVNGLGSAGVIGREREKERALERHVSSASIGSSVTGRFTTPIDEEDPSFLFNMEEEDDAQSRARKRVSGGQLAAASPLSTAWTYASAAAGSSTTASTTNGSKARTGSAVESVGGR